MNPDLLFWVLARVCGLGSFATVSLAVVTGMALRSGLFDRLATNRALKSTHEYMQVLWIPLGLLHVLALLLDGTARLLPQDAVVPFLATYYGFNGRLAIGLGSLAFDLVAIIAVTSWFRSRIPAAAWRWIHRLAYPAYALLFLHAVLSGTDFSDPVVSAITWATAFALGIFALARGLWGRLPAR